MPKKLKEREYVQCSACLKWFPLRSISAITVPKHRDPFEPSKLCSGSGKPIESIRKRWE